MTPDAPPGEILEIQRNAELLYNTQEVEAALDRMAVEIGEHLQHENPIILCVLLGGIVPTGRLMTRFAFPCELSYVHATRYRNETVGRDLHWIADVYGSIRGRTVLVVDDILDEGETLARLENALMEQGAYRVYKAVLTRKQRVIEAASNADFIGLDIPDRYVFGYGMDYHGYLRNLSGIYALADT